MKKTLIITKITKQKQNSKRYNIHVNDQYAFSVHEDVLIAKRLIKGKEITNEDIETILKEEEENKIWQKAIKYLSFRPRTRKELEKYLIAQDYEQEMIQNVILKLQAKKWLDDRRYAEEFVEEQIRLKPKGKKLIAQEMKRKGISSTYIQESLSKINSETEYQMALELAKKKALQNRKEDWVTIQRKVGGYLRRKGFSYEIIWQILHDLKKDLSIDSDPDGA
ncbi:RecX family transcriptional regulator [Tepidibacillus sp. LV47]|uniref:RecX family transcriptional regulator n=1 Tax=Tepidibacillus sp. LV47 TaxID=3398228 RepID=UPI003AAD7688